MSRNNDSRGLASTSWVARSDYDLALKALLRAMPICLPLAVRWVTRQEQRILRDGLSLDEACLSDARLMGVAIRELVRLLKVGTQSFAPLGCENGRI